MIKFLTTPHSFIKYSRSGKRKCVSIYFNETLQKMSIDKPRASYILITDIQVAEFISISNLNFSSFDLSKILAFRIFTTKKSYEFSSDNKVLRDEFVKNLNTLIKLSREYMSSMGLKKYCESIIHGQQGENSLRALYKSKHQVQEKQVNQKLNQDMLEKQVIQGVVNSIISIIEKNSKERDSKKFKRLIKENTKEKTRLNEKQEKIKSILIKKDQEISMLKQKIHKVENQIEMIKKPLWQSGSCIFSVKIWTLIIEFLSAGDVVWMRIASRSLRNATDKVLHTKAVWRKIGLGGLQPREIMYKLYFKNFYNTSIRGVFYDVEESISAEIHNDVWRGFNDFNKETEEILILLCKYNPSLCYCQGMHFVAHFLYGIYKSTDEVLKVMDSLLRPPFYLSELWKDGFSRLRLGIFQLDFLLKIKLPFLSKHLKDLEINLDMIVTPWFLTVFTYFKYELDLPKDSILEIWDHFLLQGWPSLISACLTIFHLTEHLVLEKNLEQTLTILKNKIPFKNLSKTLPKFEIDPQLLEDLELSHVCNSEF
ncbi:hypothetical protein SteCoe_1530 [Stentor coeruleus]|uniref:Rab-GAP TBC domain-containing protein n=1 Tax=Stentor coeruleus TaxID=5963 RepID=A0A1R2D1R8_9CILI|nr:hypothetical protein SteCoe_1530 [Stentor coeruleus]